MLAKGGLIRKKNMEDERGGFRCRYSNRTPNFVRLGLQFENKLFAFRAGVNIWMDDDR
jgi:hypothetical protein